VRITEGSRGHLERDLRRHAHLEGLLLARFASQVCYWPGAVCTAERYGADTA
jgi:hypothetical protein